MKENSSISAESFSPWTVPVIRWAGSKRKILPNLLKFSPKSFETYFEPFAGSSCLFFSLKPKRSVLGDINGELTSFLQTLKSHPRILHRTAISKRMTEAAYYRLRDKEHPKNDLERAVRFLLLNRYCFNGLYRTNRNGHFNVPFGKRTGSLPEESTFYRASIALRTAEIVNGDFEQSLCSVKSDDFVYLDPPYIYTERKDRGEYGCGSFQLKDLDRLFNKVADLDKLGAKFLLSYLECPEFLDRAKLWNIMQLPVKRQISGFSKFRRTVNEVLVANYDAFTPGAG